MAVPVDAYQPGELNWSPDAIRPIEEARAHGYLPFPEVVAREALTPATCRNRMVLGHYEVIPVGPTFEEVMVNPSTLGKKRVQGHGPFRDMILRMLTEPSRTYLTSTLPARAGDKPAASPTASPTTVHSAPPPTPPTMAARDLLANLKSAVGGSTDGEVTVQVLRKANDGRDVYLATKPATGFTPDAIANEFGGGDFLFRFLVKGREHSTDRLVIAGDPKGVAAGTPGTATVPGSADGGLTDTLALLDKMDSKSNNAQGELMKGMAEQTRANADAMKAAFEMAKGSQPPPSGTSDLATLQQMTSSLIAQMQQAHAQDIERSREQFTQMFKLESERADREREREASRVERDRARDADLLKSMRDSDEKVEKHFQRAIEVQQESVNREREWVTEWREREEAHIEEMRSLRRDNPDETTLKTLATVMTQVDHTAGRILEAKYGVKSSLNGNGHANGNGRTPKGLPAPASAAPAPAAGGENGASMLDFFGMKAKVFSSPTLAGLLDECNRHAAKDVNPSYMAAAIFEMVSAQPELKMAFSFIASRSITEILAEGKLTGKYPALESPAGVEWFERLKGLLFPDETEDEEEAPAAPAPPAATSVR